MPFKTRNNLRKKSWKVFCGKRMQGPNKSKRHVILFSLGKVMFHYPKNSQCYRFTHVCIPDESAAALLCVLFVPGPKLKVQPL